MDPVMTRQYHAKIVLPSGLSAELTTENALQLKETITRLWNGITFDPPNIAPNGTTQLFHKSYENGAVSCGWVSSTEVPEHLTNRQLLKIAA
jgi:hypothetical protein